MNDDYDGGFAHKQHKKYMKQDHHYRTLTKTANRASRDIGLSIASLFITCLVFIYFIAKYEQSEATGGKYDAWLLLPLAGVILVIYSCGMCLIYASEVQRQREKEQNDYRKRLEQKE